MNRVEVIRERLQTALTPNTLEVIDDSHLHRGHEGAKSGLGHFTVKIKADVFNDKNTLTCHRMIYDALDSLMQTDIHALSIKILRQ